MNYSKIQKFDTANAPGVSLTLFVSGCPFKCPGCFNQEAWDYDYGKNFTVVEKNLILQELNNKVYSSFSLLGGEPFAQGLDGTISLINLLAEIKRARPDVKVWCWTGSLFEGILTEPLKKELLKLIDVLVDGRFVLEKKDLSLAHRGSSNQRVIDVKKSLQEERVVLWNFV